jgi:hypothetical protein
MVRTTALRRSACGTVLVMTVAVTVVASAGIAHAATARYASPHGVASATCSKTEPCDLVTAINDAPSHSTVVIEAGSYDKAQPLTTELADSSGLFLDIHGPTSGPAAVIYTAAQRGFNLNDSSLSYVTVLSSASNTAVFDDGQTISHVVVVASGHTACAAYGSLTDSLCVATGAGGTAIELATAGLAPGSTNTVALRGVTAEATSATGYGLSVEAGAYETLNVTATNDIFHGGLTDVNVNTSADSPTAFANLTLSHSDYLTTQDTEGGSATAGSATITADATDITKTAPTFRNAAAGDYRERASSVTVNAGASDPAGDVDVSGQPRTAGGSPDIGAYEYLPTPTVGKLVITAAGEHTAHLTVPVNAEGLPTKITLTVRSGKRHRVFTTAAGSAPTKKIIKLKLHGLHRHTRYRLRATVTSSGGRALSSTRTLRTH